MAFIRQKPQIVAKDRADLCDRGRMPRQILDRTQPGGIKPTELDVETFGGLIPFSLAMKIGAAEADLR
jgi:hypothetical protein